MSQIILQTTLIIVVPFPLTIAFHNLDIEIDRKIEMESVSLLGRRSSKVLAQNWVNLIDTE